MGRKNAPQGRSSRRDRRNSRKYDDRDYGRGERDRERDYRSDRDYDRDRDRDRDRRREDDRRDYDSYRDSRSDRRDRRDRDRREDRDRRSSRDEPRRGKYSHEKRTRRERRRDPRGRGAPPLSRNFSCHICAANHWTTDCPRLDLHPEDYPLMDRNKGCRQCGQRGHKVAHCTRRKYHCRECGGIHDTKDCVYTHQAEEWHEFMDAASKHVFYVNYADPKEVQWDPPSHKLDIILWYCPTCQVMIPTEYDECLKCHAPRPVSAEDGDITSSDEESDSYSDDSSSDSGSSDKSSASSNHD